MNASSTATQVLGLLLRAQGPSSGEQMGQALGLTRAAVGKAVGALREQGFVIDARSNSGYALLEEPASFLPARVEARLPQACLGLPVIHYAEIDSTNLEARRRAEAGQGHGACVTADFQSAGRGRLDRRWLSPRSANLLFSLLLRPALGLSEVFALTNLTAVAICLALESELGLNPLIKWPNDVYLDGRKLAGILTEFTCRAERLDHVVVGVGLNVNLTPAQLAKLPAPAASLRAATGRVCDRCLVLAAILREADGLYDRLLAGGRDMITDLYNQRSWLQGRWVEVRQGASVLQGRAQGVAADGALVIVDRDGHSRAINHGDVSVLSIKP